MEEALPDYEGPSLQKAKEFYNTTLVHRVVDCNQKSGFRLANEGELIDDTTGNPADTYSFWHSPMSSLDEFGIGISLYFKTLKAIALVMLICAFINLVAIYENKKFNLTQDDVDTYNALFPDGEQLSATPNELIGSAYGATAGTLKFYKQVAADIAITCVIGSFLLFSIKAQSKIVEEIDKAQQTTQDYSICVKHPPTLHKEGPNAGQPYTVDHFKEFFKKFGEVSSVTMVKKNGCLLRAIAEREVYIDTLDKILIQQGDSTTASEDKGFVSNSLMVSLGFINSDIPSLKKKIEECRTKVIQLSSLEYPTHQVFVTFNSQADQVKCLNNTFHSTLMKWQGAQASHSSYFDGELLTIRESHEPSDIIYENNDKGFWPTYLSRAISYFIVAALMVADYYLINALLKTGGVAAPIVITLINMILPMAMKYLTNEVEIHHDNAHRQSSLLLKLVAVRCINAAVLIYLAAPFEDTFQLARIQAIQNTLLADAIMMPVLRFFDPSKIFFRFLVPNCPCFSFLRPKTQSELNALFRSDEWTLAERYTDVIKSIFMSMFYAVILPSGLFISAFTMLSTYFTDKYSLFYQWRRPPQFDESLGVIARYFLCASLWVHLITSRIYFANWPYTGPYKLEDTQEADCNFLICHTNSDMTDDQKRAVILYSVVCTIVFCIVGWLTLNAILGDSVIKFFGIGGADTEDNVEHVHGKRAIEFKELFSAIYIPTVSRLCLLDSIVCVPLDGVEEKFLPESIDTSDGNTKNESLATREFFPHLAKDFPKIENVFGSVRTYVGASVYVPGGNNLRLSSPVVPISAKLRANSSMGVVSGSGGSTKGLPHGWEKKNLPDGKHYYVNHNDKSTHWTLPASILAKVEEGNKITMGGHSQSQASKIPGFLPQAEMLRAPGAAITAPLLPANWEQKVSDDGKVYYVNHETKTTSWTLPQI